MSSPPPHATSTITLSSLPPTTHEPPYTLTHLDTLLTTYLTYLDTYTRHRTQLSTSLSTGFLHLAQAQRSSMLPPGQRYGQEMYDQRMKAGQRVKMVELRGAVAGAGGDARAAEESEGRRFEIEVYTYAAAEGNPTPTSTAQTETSSSSSSSSSPSPPSPIPKKSEATSQEPLTQTHTQQQPPPTPPPTTTTAPSPARSPLPTPAPPPKRPTPNPISQFALLPPPPLRQSQTAFLTALASIPTLLNTSRAMDVLEDEIERVRRALGLSLDGEIGTEEAAVDEMNTDTGTGTATKTETKETDAEEREGKMSDTAIATASATPASPTTPKRRNLASRSKVSEPRSRVLKLGT
jgi:hypothetical protein